MKTIRELAISRVKYNKSRSILICVALILTSTLLMTIGTIGNGIVNYEGMTVSEAAGNHHVTYGYLTESELNTLKNHVYIEALSFTELFGDAIKDKLNLSLLNEKVIKEGVNAKALTAGRLPEAENEIAASPTFFEKLGAKPELGETVSISFRVYGKGEILTKDFIITGLQDQIDVSNLGISDSRLAYTAVISNIFADNMLEELGYERRFNGKARILGEETLNYDEMMARIKEIAKDVGIDERSINENGNYLAWKTSPGSEALSFVSLISFVIIIFAGLIIYSIYYVAIITNIQELGKLKALGATKRQMRGLLLREGLISAAISIPIGLLLGFIIAKLTMVLIISIDGGKISASLVPIFSWQLLIIVILVVIITVIISLLRPANMAAKISPIEAIRYQEDSTGKKAMRSGYDKVTIPRLCMSNLKRNSRRTLVTIVTMGLGGIMFLCVGTILSSMNRMDIARVSLPRGEFQVKLLFSHDDEAYPENELNNLQKSDIMGKSLISEIEKTPGVTSIEEEHGVLAYIDHPSYKVGEKVTIEGFTEENLEEIGHNLAKGSLNYDNLVSDNEIIFGWDQSFEEKGFSIGDTIKFQLLDGDKLVPFEGKISASVKGGNSDFIMAKDLLDSLITQVNPTVGIYVYCEESDYENVKNALNSIVDKNSQFILNSIDEELTIADISMSAIKISMYFILGLLGLISFMNLINTMITSIITRRRELGVLQALGMSNKQLGNMLFQEGLIFTVGTLLISLTIGNLLGYMAYLGARSNGILSIVYYHYPLIETLVIIIALVVGQLGITYFISRYAFKESLSRRMRYE